MQWKVNWAHTTVLMALHDDVIKWKHFPCNWPFVRGISPVTGEFPAQRPVTRSFDVSLICALNKRLSKQSLGWWFETPSRSLWRHFLDPPKMWRMRWQLCYLELELEKMFIRQKTNTSRKQCDKWYIQSVLCRETLTKALSAPLA